MSKPHTPPSPKSPTPDRHLAHNNRHHAGQSPAANGRGAFSPADIGTRNAADIGIFSDGQQHGAQPRFPDLDGHLSSATNARKGQVAGARAVAPRAGPVRRPDPLGRRRPPAAPTLRAPAMGPASLPSRASVGYAVGLTSRYVQQHGREHCSPWSSAHRYDSRLNRDAAVKPTSTAQLRAEQPHG
jgi:hypothetical protein